MEINHQKSYQVLQMVDAICKKHDISYFLMTGTVLGAVRHKGFIPWDDDIDIGMTISNYDKFAGYANEISQDEYFWSTTETNELHPRFFGQVLYKGRQCLDVISIPKTSNNYILRKLQWLANRVLYVAYLQKIGEGVDKKAAKLVRPLSVILSRQTLLKLARRVLVGFEGKDTDYYINLHDRYPMEKALIKREWLEGLDEMYFEDGMYPVFKETEAYMQHLYGDYKILPPEDERKPPHQGDVVRIKELA
jgi:lipopolysaccharide cholinephosphotransferase